MGKSSRETLCLALGLLCVAAAADAPAARAAPILTTLAAFDGVNGLGPVAGLTFGLDGTLYGTTEFGGSGGGEFGNGTVYELSGTDHRTLTTVATFNGGNGAGPLGGLTLDIFGNLYGTATSGGASGSGTSFRLSGTGHRTLTVLASFDGADGATPSSAPTLYLPGEPFVPSFPYLAGNLFGTTAAGGASGDGTVYELSGADHRTLTTLRSFDGSGDGQNPSPSLVADAAGDLFGTTETGGPGGAGTVFELSGPDHRTLTTLAAFDTSNGAGPEGGLAFDFVGNLYGTTIGGGPGFGGTIFELSGPRHRTMTTLATFGLFDPHGSAPTAGLLIDAAGNLYGTTTGGGVDNAPADLGSVFKLSADHKTLTTLYTFTGNADGGIPQAALVADLDGNLYGTSTSFGAGGDGTVFELTGTGFVTILDLLHLNAR